MKPACSPAFTVTRYVIKPHRPEPSLFFSEHEAARVARSAVKRLGTVRLYEVRGEPVTNLWSRPRLVATYQAA